MYFDASGSHAYNTLVSYNPVTCQDSLITVIDQGDYYFLQVYDVAAGPNGEIYLMINAGSVATGVVSCISLLNVQTGALTCLVDFLPIGLFGGTSMVCSADSILYVAGNGLISYDLKTGVVTDHGLFPNFYNASGDMVFKNEQLYVTISANQQLLQVNIDNPSASQVVASYSQIPLQRQIWGIASNVYDCDSSDMYLITGVLNPNQSREYDVYGLDFATQQTTFLCTGGGCFYTGSTTFNEFLASDCSVRLDLDHNNSSGADNGNYQVTTCAGAPIFISDTSDMVLYSGYRIDSLCLRLNPAYPGEILTSATVPVTLAVAGQNTPHLTFSNTSNILYPDFQAALRSVFWQYSGSGSPAGGLRTVEVTLYARGGRQDTSFAFLHLELPPSAGRDTSESVCMGAVPFQLDSLLSADADTGGMWIPALPGAVFDPAIAGTYSFQYLTTGHECPSDTAIVEIVVPTLPAFSLGSDASICYGDSLLLLAPQTAVWQDGSMSNTFAANQAGLFWAEVTNAQGCVFRDSILLSQIPLQNTNEVIQRCFGQDYIWNGHALQTDTTVCATFLSIAGCDSSHCLTLDFFHPLLSTDTTLCEGQSISWHSQVYNSSGTFTDTVLLDGCQTITSLQINLVPADTISIFETICPESTYLLGNQEYTLPGLYVLNVPTEAGCDSIIALSLAWQETPTLVIAGDTSFCSGSTTVLSTSGFDSYAWSLSGATGPNLTVTNSGTYTVTATNAQGCTATASLAVSESAPIVAAWELQPPLCHGAADGWIELLGIEGGSSPFSYRFLQNAPVTQPFFEHLPAGAYAIRTSDADGCFVDTTLVLIDPEALTLSLGPDIFVSAGNAWSLSAQTTGGQGALTYVWLPPAGLSCADCPNPVLSPSDSVVYLLTVTDANGCSATDSIRVFVQGAGFLFIPNVFSPDDDGKNDFFGVFADPDRVRSIELLRVYDRWGTLVYEESGAPFNDLNKGWDGAFRGNPAAPGVYVWYTSVRLTNGEVLQRSGDVLLQR